MPSKIDLILTFVWVIVGGYITYRFPNSVAWIAFMSLYANIVGHWGAYRAAKIGKKS